MTISEAAGSSVVADHVCLLGLDAESLTVEQILADLPVRSPELSLHLLDALSIAEEPVPAAGIVDAILAGDRIIGWVRAQQYQWLAKFAKPGVAVPIPDLLAMVCAPSATVSVHEGHPVQPDEDDLSDPNRAYTDTAVYGDPVWDAVLAGEAARLAAVEIAAAMNVAPITAQRRLEHALVMVDELPATLHALAGGEIDDIRAKVIAEHTEGLDPELRREIEWQVLPGAGGHTPGRLGRDVAAAAIAIDPELANRRAEAARARRGVKLRGLADDLARLSADLPAAKAALAYGVLDQLAEAIGVEAAAGRGISQIRADVFSDLFTALAETGHIDLRSYPTEDADDESLANDAGDAGIGAAIPNVADNTHAEGDVDGPGCDVADDSDADPQVDVPGSNTAIDPAIAEHVYVSDDEVGTDECEGAEPTFTAEPATPSANNRSSLTEMGAEGNVIAPPPVPSVTCDYDPAPWSPMCAHLDVTVAMSTLAGLDDLPAQLTSQGAITAELARALAAAWKSVRLIVIGNGPPGTHPDDGATSEPCSHHDGCTGNAGCGTDVDYGRTVYRPPAAVAELVLARDRTCRFPGCGRPAQRCDIDHREPFRPGTDTGGPTCPCNLDCLCRYHHRVKTFTGWRATRSGNELQWTSPIGRRYTDPAPDLPIGIYFTADDLARRRSLPDPAPF